MQRKRQTPSLTNTLNQSALTQLLIGYDEAKAYNNDGRRHGFNNAINLLRVSQQFVSTISIASTIPFLGGGRMGQFVVDANNGLIGDL